MLEGGWLFPGLDPVDPLSTRQLNRAIHAAAEEAHIDKRVSMHTLRHYVSFLTMSGQMDLTSRWSKDWALRSRRADLITRHSFMTLQTVQKGEQLVCRAETSRLAV
jgi:integrase